jgi:hypothetical protein
MGKRVNDNFKFMNYAKKEDLQDKIHTSRKNKSLIHSLDKLICQYHDKTKFIIDGEIPNSTDYDRLTLVKDRKPSNTYTCDKCNKEKDLDNKTNKELDVKKTKEDYHFSTKYYDCFFCQGHVLGEPIKKSYYPSKEMRKLGFKEDKINYYCIVCNNLIGYELINKK